MWSLSLLVLLIFAHTVNTASEKSAVSSGHSKEDLKESVTKHLKEDSKENLKEDSKEHSKDDSKEHSKDDSKKRLKEDSKEYLEDDSKEHLKKDSKELSKEDSKELSKEDSKTHSKEQAKAHSRLKGASRKHSKADSKPDKFNYRDYTHVNMTNRSDFLTAGIKPWRRMPLYMLPISVGSKVLMQIAFIGFDLKMKPQPMETTCFWVLIDWLKHIVVTTPFLLMALNCWMRDWEDWSTAGDDLLEEHNTYVNRMSLRLDTYINSPNFAASIALWTSFAVQGPAALGLKPKYFAVPFRAFPLNPFGTTWLKPVKWLYAICLLPYALAITPAYLVSSCFIQFVQLKTCCAHVTNSCSFIYGYCQCTWMACCGCIKCCSWCLLATITFGLWAYARTSFWAYHSMFIPMMYYCFLLFLSDNVILRGCQKAYISLIGGKFSIVDIDKTIDPMSANQPQRYAPPGQMNMDPKTQFAEGMKESFAIWSPLLTPAAPLDDRAVNLLKTYDAVKLSNDFEGLENHIETQRQNNEAMVVGQDEDMSFPVLLTDEDILKAKAIIFTNVLKPSLKLFQTILAVSFMCRVGPYICALTRSPDPVSMFRDMGYYMLDAYIIIFSERKASLYIDNLRITLREGVASAGFSVWYLL